MTTRKYYSKSLDICRVLFIIVAILVIALLSSCSNNTKPPHYGVFIKEAKDLKELTERELYDTPVIGELKDIEQVQSTEPTFIIWRQNIQLDYLDFYKLGQAKNRHEKIKYYSKPGENGVYEITPASLLSEGEYCIVQGDPLGMFLPGWCFRIGSKVENQHENTLAAPELKEEPTAITIIEPELILIPAGDFQMGCDPTHNNSYPCKNYVLPLHSVYLDTYKIDKYEVTNAQYARCVRAGACVVPESEPSDFYKSNYKNPAYVNHPVVFVSWQDAVNYCTWAGKRLPTEAEWEKAARGTTIRVYPWGDQTADCKLANFTISSSCEVNTQTNVVGSYPTGASPYGVMDMAGNVGEWVNDWYQSDYYTISPLRNPRGPASGNAGVLRGGGWSTPSSNLGISNRAKVSRDHKESFTGFRCASSPGN